MNLIQIISWIASILTIITFSLSCIFSLKKIHSNKKIKKMLINKEMINIKNLIKKYYSKAGEKINSFLDQRILINNKFEINHRYDKNISSFFTMDFSDFSRESREVLISWIEKIEYIDLNKNKKKLIKILINFVIMRIQNDFVVIRKYYNDFAYYDEEKKKVVLRKKLENNFNNWLKTDVGRQCWFDKSMYIGNEFKYIVIEYLNTIHLMNNSFAKKINQTIDKNIYRNNDYWICIQNLTPKRKKYYTNNKNIKLYFSKEMLIKIQNDMFLKIKEKEIYIE